MTSSTTVTISDRTAWTKGAYLAFLSPWNAGALVQGKDYVDTATLNPDLFPNSVTVSWTWPERTPTGVWNFDAINFGNYLYTTPQTPITSLQVNGIRTLTQNYGLTLGGDTSKYNVITDFFLTSKAGDLSTKLFEIQVFLHTPAATKGYVVGEPSLGTYNDAQGHAWSVSIHKSQGTSPDIMFMPKGGGDALSGSIDLKGMLDWLAGLKIIAGTEYFNGLAMGAEVRQGSGSMVINSFGIDYAAKGAVKNDYAPVIDSNGGGDNAALGIASGTKAVTTVHATDADGTMPTYAIAGGADAALFTIDKTSGALAFVSAPSYASPKDVGGDNVYNVVVQASDGVHADTQALAVSIKNPNAYAPVIDSNGGGASGAKSVAAGTTAVTTVHAADADGTTPTYAIAGGTDAALFTIDASTGALAFKNAPSYFAPKDADGDNLYGVTVQASDGVHVDAQDLAVSVTAVNQSVLAKALAAGSTPTTTTYALTSDRYDASWKITRTSETDVARFDGTKMVVEQRDAGGKLVASTIATDAGNTETVQHFDAKGALTGKDVFTFDVKVTIDHYDGLSQSTGRDVFFLQAGKAVEQHYDAHGTLTGTDVATAMGTRDRVDHLDASGALTGYDLVYPDASKLTTQHYDARGVFLGAENVTLAATQALDHDPMKAWLIG